MTNTGRIKLALKIVGKLKSVQRAEQNRILKTAERMWVESNPKIHLLNYWWFRYFTNQFELFLINNYLLSRESIDFKR